MKEEPEGAVDIRIAVPADVKYAYPLLEEIARSAKARGTGIAKRTPQGLCRKIYDGKAVIAVADNPAYRNAGVATSIKQRVFELARQKYPSAKIFSITTGAAILKMNHRLGFEPVTYEAITGDERFRDQCKGCVNHSDLESQGRKRCLCTAMLFTPGDGKERSVNVEINKVYA